MKPEHPAETHADTENVPTAQTVTSAGNRNFVIDVITKQRGTKLLSRTYSWPDVPILLSSPGFRAPGHSSSVAALPKSPTAWDVLSSRLEQTRATGSSSWK